MLPVVNPITCWQHLVPRTNMTITYTSNETQDYDCNKVGVASIRFLQNNVCTHVQTVFQTMRSVNCPEFKSCGLGIVELAPHRNIGQKLLVTPYSSILDSNLGIIPAVNSWNSPDQSATIHGVSFVKAPFLDGFQGKPRGNKPFCGPPISYSPSNEIARISWSKLGRPGVKHCGKCVLRVRPNCCLGLKYLGFWKHGKKTDPLLDSGFPYSIHQLIHHKNN